MIDSLQWNFVNPQEKGAPLPKFGEWDVNDPASAEGFTVIFNKARTEKKAGGRPDSPSKDDHAFKHGAVLGKPPAVSRTYLPYTVPHFGKPSSLLCLTHFVFA